VVWIATLYISWALQSRGLGRAAMRAVEKLAADAPVNGESAVLDTVPQELQMSSVLVQKVYVAQGNPVPLESNEAWFTRQGYREFHRQDAAYCWIDPATEKKHSFPAVFLRKGLKEARKEAD
jgi:hypothetical protein